MPAAAPEECRFSRHVYVLVICTTLFFRHCSDADGDTLSSGEILSGYRQDRLISGGGNFKLGFFSLGADDSGYLGIWFDRSPQEGNVVWIGNRGYTIDTSTAYLAINSSDRGEKLSLNIFYGYRGQMSIFQGIPASANSTLVLLDSGNLVFQDAKDGRVLWQSIEDDNYSSNSFLPGMILGWSKNKTTRLVSWSSPVDPSPGRFSLGLDPNGTKQLVVWDRDEVAWKSGIWDGRDFPYISWISLNLSFSFFSNKSVNCFVYSGDGTSFPLIWVLKSTGEIIQFGSRGNPPRWTAFAQHPAGSCRRTGRIGCVRELADCGSRDGYFTLWSDVSPSNWDWQLQHSTFNASQCQNICRDNCSCVAYAAGSEFGCYFWEDTLFQELGPGEVGLYALETLTDTGQLTAPTYFFPKGGKRRLSLGIGLSVGLGAFMFFLVSISCCLIRRKLIMRRKTQVNDNREQEELYFFDLDASTIGNGRLTGEGPKAITLAAIAASTENFSESNQLGKGGFGPVYKGKLTNGQEIAVKRLSSSSGQGLIEFKNEVRSIAKLQHRNLVRLLGYCIEGAEKILIYEFMPNKSLDYFLFDQTRQKLLQWRRRFHIIEGIVQGLLYLHNHSRLRVIHRDLKASNILLDAQMNPKISDFGMARIFREDESQANTNRVVGTFGYMSPEYAMEGLFSERSDVYSFGVLLLEIVSGRRNSSFLHSDGPLNLLGFAWQLWEDGRAMELMDPSMEDSAASVEEAQRCIHVGLLCVQEKAADRPTMAGIQSMLGKDGAGLSAPKQPPFTARTAAAQLEVMQEACSINGVTLSVVTAR